MSWGYFWGRNDVFTHTEIEGDSIMHFRKSWKSSKRISFVGEGKGMIPTESGTLISELNSPSFTPDRPVTFHQKAEGASEEWLDAETRQGLLLARFIAPRPKRVQRPILAAASCRPPRRQLRTTAPIQSFARTHPSLAKLRKPDPSVARHWGFHHRQACVKNRRKRLRLGNGEIEAPSTDYNGA